MVRLFVLGCLVLYMRPSIYSNSVSAYVSRFNDHFCAHRWKVNSCGQFAHNSIYHNAGVRYKERERERERERRWCVKLTAEAVVYWWPTFSLLVSRDYCSNSRARRVTVHFIDIASFTRGRSLVSGFVREIVVCTCTFAVAPRGNSLTIFRRAKGKDAPLLRKASVNRLREILLWKLTAALYYTNWLFVYLEILRL